ncbi:actin-related protein 9 isoform X1 [Iris pallida]|uniref:Actin-related protein 9 isoform X1 n=1 Tax=Iris pallida TaxID=29817 RepID=A0AAX6DLD2_IRIPA|nr:actin-related protein 9 isoform X1 [Iris pallida]
MEYLKTIVPSQLISERGSNIVVINPGSANVRMGSAHQQVPFNIPHCIARHVRPPTGDAAPPKMSVLDQMLNSEATPEQHSAREKAYDVIASVLKIPFLDEETENNSFPRKMGRVDGHNSYQNRTDTKFTWTNVVEKSSRPSSAAEWSDNKITEEESRVDNEEGGLDEYTFKDFICGQDALKISPTEPYCLRRPIRRGHFNVSQQYPLQQVLEDLFAIWDWILTDKLYILPADRNLYSAILVVPETFDTREIKELLSIVLRDLRFSSAVVHQEGLAAAFGNGLSTACVVNIGAQVTSVI